MANDTADSSSSSYGIGFLNFLTLIFVAAKLFGAITWSWWLVFLPTIVSAGLVLLILIGLFGLIIKYGDNL